jgi:ligand-binding sensor domain-containing protein
MHYPKWHRHYRLGLSRASDRLISLDVHGLMQDRTGNVWAATSDGVFRYEGLSMTVICSGALHLLEAHFAHLQSKKLPDGHHLGRSGTRRSPEDFRSASAGEANHGEWQHRALPDSVSG